jgi:hypothetical protein
MRDLLCARYWKDAQGLEVEAAEGFRLLARGILVIAPQATARGERVYVI